MSRRIIIVSIILVLILATGFGIYSVSNRQPQIARQKTEKSIDFSKIPEPELVAEYKFDSLITDAVFYDNGRPKVVATEKYIRFYNPDGSVRKEIKIEHRQTGRGPTRERCDISDDGEYVGIESYADVAETWFKYIDKDGNVLFDKETGYYGYVSPKGDYIVFISIMGDIVFDDKNGNEIAKYKGRFGSYAGSSAIEFSEDGKYCLIGGGYFATDESQVMLFVDKGRRLVCERKLPIQFKQFSLSSDGKFFAVSGYIHNEKGRILEAPIYFMSQQKILWKKDVGPFVKVSPMGNKILTSKLRYYLRKAPDSYFKIFSKQGEVIGFLKADVFKNKDTLLARLAGADIKDIDGKTYVAADISFRQSENLIITNGETNTIYCKKYKLTTQKNILGHEEGEIFDQILVLLRKNVVLIGKDTLLIYKIMR